MKTCPKCAYTRATADQAVPDWQCPKCGIAYAKFEAQQVADWQVKRSSVPAAAASPAEEAPSSARKVIAWMVMLAALAAYAGYARFMARSGGKDGGRESAAPVSRGPSHPGLPVLAMTPEASANLSQLATTRVVLFGTDWCPNCAHVRRLLSRQGVRYTELNVEKDPRASAFQEQNMPVRGFPVTVIGERIVMGYDEKEILAGLKAL